MYKERYTKRKEELLNDSKINSKNRAVMAKFLEYEEYKLKRKEGLSEVDERSYKTLYGYIGRLKKLNKWFKNKTWAELTDDELKEVIDDLEDGNIKNQYGKRYMDRSLYYQMMQGKLFSMVGKSSFVRDVLQEFSIRGRDYNDEVRFIEEVTFRKIVDCAITPEHRCLLWLGFDIGENIGSLLELDKNDIKRQINTDTNEPEYLVILSKDILKRSRTPRSEVTNYKETVQYLDIVLANIKPVDKMTSNKFTKPRNLNELHKDDKLFKFGFSAAQKFLKRAVNLAGARCIPGGQRVTWKDLRSSMACDSLNKGWSRDEVNARLGHKPSSRIIDRYISYNALDRKKPKAKVYQSNLRKMEMELEKQKDINKLQSLRLESVKKEQEHMREDFKQMMISSKAEVLDMMNKVDRIDKKELVAVN